jgi:hypothetical protein
MVEDDLLVEFFEFGVHERVGWDKFNAPTKTPPHQGKTSQDRRRL